MITAAELREIAKKSGENKELLKKHSEELNRLGNHMVDMAKTGLGEIHFRVAFISLDEVRFEFGTTEYGNPKLLEMSTSRAILDALIHHLESGGFTTSKYDMNDQNNLRITWRE